MSSGALTSAILLFATIISAQFTPREQIANLILAGQSAITSNTRCGTYYDSVVPSAIAVRIFGNYTLDTCYTIATLFSPNSYPNDTTVFTPSDGALSSCDPLNSMCGNAYQASGQNFYNPEANYSQAQVDVYYGSSLPLLNEFSIKVFARPE
ncbi:Hypothetical protein D9617_28g064820 [Elsinoe fawcettii]|nr:Hypothetical protein D9617_28g064820 [Elsinoe fawcettii]